MLDTWGDDRAVVGRLATLRAPEARPLMKL